MLRRILPLLLALLVLAGCGGRKAQPTLQVSAEQKGASLVIRAQTTNFVAGKDGHIHIRLNDGPEAMIYGSTYTIPEVKPGSYKIDVELADQKHVPIGVRQTIQVEVK
jgi:hypothetical protein